MLTNTGSTAGSEVVQPYVRRLPPRSSPPLALKTLAKVKDVKPGESRKVALKLDKYAVSYREERTNRWVVGRGESGVRVRRSSAMEDLELAAMFRVEKGFEWNGL